MSGRTTDAENDYLASQIARHDDELEALRNLMCEKVAEAVADGIMRSVSDPAMWSAAVTAIQRQARDQAGGWLLGGVKAIFGRIGWVALALLTVYTLGGWGAVVVMLKGWVSGGGNQ